MPLCSLHFIFMPLCSLYFSCHSAPFISFFLSLCSLYSTFSDMCCSHSSPRQAQQTLLSLPAPGSPPTTLAGCENPEVMQPPSSQLQNLSKWINLRNEKCISHWFQILYSPLLHQQLSSLWEQKQRCVHPCKGPLGLELKISALEELRAPQHTEQSLVGLISTASEGSCLARQSLTFKAENSAAWAAAAF